MTRITNNRPVAVPVSKPAAPAAAAVAVEAAATKAPGWTPVKASAAPRTTAAVATSAEVANAYFTAFKARDVAAIEKLYQPGATFKDPIYDLKNRDETVKMWSTLFKVGKDLNLTYEVLDAGKDSARVAWKADYKVFGRPVHNEAVSELKISDGKISQQQDSWSWSKWAKQALPLGPLVDFPPVKAAVLFFLRRS